MNHLWQTQKTWKIWQKAKFIGKQEDPGAVVIVKVDHRAVSHVIGIVGIIFQVREGGGAKVNALIIDNPCNDY